MFIAHILYKTVAPFLSNTLMIKKRNGISYELDLREGLDLSMFLFGKFQAHTIHSKYLNLANDTIVVDVGGNFGYMALQYAQKFQAGSVISFEPTHYACLRFERNLALNPHLAKRISLIKRFVSDEVSKNAKIKAFSSWRVDTITNKHSARHDVHLGIEKSTDGVSSITLDYFFEKNSINKVNLIKIDTDGHEFKVLKGARKTISKYRPLVLFEIGKYVMSDEGISFSFYIEYFKKINYKLFDSKSGKRLDEKNWNSLIPDLGTIDAIAIPDHT